MSTPSSSRISVLAFGAFGVGTSGYIVAGLLPALSGTRPAPVPQVAPAAEWTAPAPDPVGPVRPVSFAASSSGFSATS